MNILLKGYFDKNLGDDVMQLILVRALRDSSFYVYHNQEEMLIHLMNEENVHINKACDSLDACVNIIGTGFQFRGKRACVEKLVTDLLSKEKRLPKTAVVDSSLERICGKLSKYLTKKELKKYDFISTRDEASKEAIENMTGKKNVALHRDVVFSLSDEYIFERSGEGALGIIVVNRIGSGNYEYAKAVAQACDDYIEKNNKKALLFAFDTGSENDTSVALSVKALMKNKDMAEIICYNSDVTYVMKNIARCEKIVSSRFHGAVLSLIARVPVMIIGDNLKLKYLSEKYSIPMIEKSQLTAESLIEMINSEFVNTLVSAEDKNDAYRHISDLLEYLGE